jgi:hypothetical protein
MAKLTKQAIKARNIIADHVIKERLEYLRGEIENECISYAEIAELQSLRGEIQQGDTVLLEWAGVEEKV